MANPVRCSDRLTIRIQPELNALVDRAAHARGMRSAEYIRQALLTGLRLDGLDPATIAPRDAGTLYNVVDGQRNWALVADGAVKSTYRSAEKPADEQGGVWLPIHYEDSEPFDLALHWRLAPVYTIVDQYGRLDRVLCTYPVVLKSLEHA